MTDSQIDPVAAHMERNKQLAKDAQALALRQRRARVRIHEYDCCWVRNTGTGTCTCGLIGGAA